MPNVEKLIFKSHSWWHTPVILTFRKKKQENCLQTPGRSDLRSPGCSGYIARLCQNYSKTNKENTRIHLKREVNGVSWCQPKILSLELPCATDSSDLVIFVPTILVTRLRATATRTLEGTCKMHRSIPGLCTTSGSDSGAGPETVAMTNTLTKSNWGREGLVWLRFRVPVELSWRAVKAETQSAAASSFQPQLRAVRNECILACWLSYAPLPLHRPAHDVVSPIFGGGLPTSGMIKTVPLRHAHRTAWSKQFLHSLSPQVMLGCVNLTGKPTSTGGHRNHTCVDTLGWRN